MSGEPVRKEEGHGPDWQPIDLLLSQGSAEEVTKMRNQVSSDPMRALDLADTVALVEQFRHLRIEASPEFAGKLQDVGLHSDRFCRSHYQPRAPMWQMPLVAGLAAAATFFMLWWCDADALLRQAFTDEPEQRSFASVATDEASEKGQQRNAASLPAVPVSREQLTWEQTVVEIAQRLERETSGHLRDAFRDGIEGSSDPLKQWLDPRNALVLLRLDHELRANAELRAEALRSRGTLTEVDGRVQELADGLAAELVAMVRAGSSSRVASNIRNIGSRNAADKRSAAARDARRVADVAWAMRALIGAGSTRERDQALEQGGNWLVTKMPELYGASLVSALSGVLELAAVTGLHFDAVSEHGQRLLDGVLLADDENWRRRRPELLAGRVEAGVLGEAGRILARLPAFGADPGHCAIVRQLVLGQLRERRSLGQDRPEVLAAMVYGLGDLLNAEKSERDRLAWTLRRWKPTRLAPDFRTVQQIAWSLTPGSRGFTRLQRELRQLAVLPEPEGIQERAAFCLCLATNYAGFVGSLLASEPPVRGS